MSTKPRRLLSVSGNGSWPALNLGARPATADEQASGGAGDSLGQELARWFQQQFAQAPPTAEQLAEWQRLARGHRPDPQRRWLCKTCMVAYPCVFRVLAHAALITVRADDAEFDTDPVVRLAARMVAAQRAEEGYTAVMLPLLSDCTRIVDTHRPDADHSGVCPVCSTGSPVAWPCDLYGLATQVVDRFGAHFPRLDGR